MADHTTHHSTLTLVIDQGSHASRVALFSQTGELIYLKSNKVSTRSAILQSAESSYDQDANEILQSIINLLNAIPAELTRQISCAGICTQRSTIVAWNRITGKPLSAAISWQDTRSQALICRLKPHAGEIQSISGLPLSAHYSAGKIHWLLNNNSKVDQANLQKQLCIAPLASYLLFNLIKEKPVIIDHSNAQRSQLFDIHTLNWSNTLLKHFQIEPHILASCAPVMHHYGHLNFNNIPVTCVVGDQNAVLSAYPKLTKKQALVNIGTGAFILSPASGHKNENPKLLHTLANSDQQNTCFVSEATVNGAGAALSWAQTHDPCDQLFKKLPGWLKQTTSPPIFINSISGLGSPWWCNGGKAEFINATKSTQAERYVAIIESIVFLIYHNIQQLNHAPDTLFISGGLSRLDTLCQKLADLSQARIERFDETESSARGCAWLANQTCKNNNLNWKTLPVSQAFKSCDTAHKKLKLSLRYQQFVGELNKRCSNS